MLFSWVNPLDGILVMTWGKLTIVLAMALVLGQLQCAAWCTVSTCDLAALNSAGSQNVPPCHRHHSDSSKNNPNPCSHGVVVVASPVSLSAAQAAVAAPMVAILQIQTQANPRLLISGNQSAALTTSPPASVGRSSAVLRI